MILTACAEDREELVPITEKERQALLQGQQQQTPSSLSGDKDHAGPNPHAKLSPAQHIAVAQQHANEGRIREALDILTRAMLENPDNSDLIGTRGSMLLAQDKVFDALVDLEKAVTLAPDNVLLLINRSQAYRKFNRLEEAMNDLNKAVSLNPELVPARFNRGTLLYGEGKYNEALADFDVCIKAAPDTAGPYFNRAVTREAAGDQPGAISDMNSFLQLSDNPEWNKVARETLASWNASDKMQK
ncbi:MAG: tetratricopeptide repeat protein [Gammaproteobacteria bacterium]|nr:tetratricopeptide repeat protein [Gammaproteobacteria bacterium]